MDIPKYFITRFGAISLQLVTRVGTGNCLIKLTNELCSRRHATIIDLPDGSVIIRNDSATQLVYINDEPLSCGTRSIITHGDLISFAGVETFKFHMGPISPLNLSPISLSPD